MAYNQIVADYFIFDPINNIDDRIFLEECKKYDNILDLQNDDVYSKNLSYDIIDSKNE